MKFLHLADLHLGKRLAGYSLIPDQQHILDEILELAAREKPDAVLIAGDVYDKSLPPAEAVTLFDDFLTRLSRQGVQALVISGNHDSAERLSFGGRLMGASGVHLAPGYQGIVEPVTLRDEHGLVDVWLLPFLRPVNVRAFYPGEELSTYTQAVGYAVEQMRRDPSRRHVLVAHQFVTGAVQGGSEEIIVGGLDNVDASALAGFDYVALGHIHSAQDIRGGTGPIRYAGAPLKYALSEIAGEKSVTLVELGPRGTVEVSALPLHPLRDLRQIRGSYDEVTRRSFYDGTPVEDYLHVILTDEQDIPDAVAQLRIISPNIVQLSYDNRRTRSQQQVEIDAQAEQRTPLELFEGLYQTQNGDELTGKQREFLSGLIREIWEEDAK